MAAVVSGLLNKQIAARLGTREVMLNDHETPVLRVSNWTLATGTRPGERPIADTGARR